MAYNPDQPRNPKGTVDGGTWRKADTRHKDADMLDGRVAEQYARLNRMPDAYYDGTMNDTDRELWAEGMDGVYERIRHDRPSDGVFDHDGSMRLGQWEVHVRHGAHDDVLEFREPGNQRVIRAAKRHDLDTRTLPWLDERDNQTLKHAVSRLPAFREGLDESSADQRFEATLKDPMDPVQGVRRTLRADPDAARLADQWMAHPRKRTFQYDGRTLDRGQARGVIRDMMINHARGDAYQTGDPNPAGTGEAAGRWFDRTWPEHHSDPKPTRKPRATAKPAADTAPSATDRRVAKYMTYDDPKDSAQQLTFLYDGGFNATVVKDYLDHPRRRTYTLEGEKLSRQRMRDYCRAVVANAAENAARDNGDPTDGVADAARRWFDRQF